MVMKLIVMDATKIVVSSFNKNYDYRSYENF